MAVSDDLSRAPGRGGGVGRVVAHIRRPHVSKLERREPTALGAAVSIPRWSSSLADALPGRSALRPDRGASRLSLGPDPAQAGHHAARDKEQLIGNCGERLVSPCCGEFFDRHEIAFKKTAHAEEQKRADAKATPRMVRRAARSSILGNWFSLTKQEPPPGISARKSGRQPARAGCGLPSRTVTTKR